MNREKRSRRKLVKKRTPSEVIEKLEEQEGSENCENVPFDKPLLHSDSATLICDEVATSRSPFEISTNEVENVDIQSEPRDRHVSITSMESVAGLGEADDQDDVTILKGLEEVHEIEVDKTVIEESIPNQPKGQRFDLLSNGDVTIPAMIMNDVDGPKKKLLVRRKKKSKTPDCKFLFFFFIKKNYVICVNLFQHHLNIVITRRRPFTCILKWISKMLENLCGISNAHELMLLLLQLLNWTE